MTLWTFFKYACLIIAANVVSIFLLWGMAAGMQWMALHWSIAIAITVMIALWIAAITLIPWFILNSRWSKTS